MLLTYVVHDLADPAVERRLHQFEIGGADRVEVAGFEKVGRRSSGAVVDDARRLGATRDGKLVRRVVAGLLGALRLARTRDTTPLDHVVVARNLECLFVVVLAAGLGRRRPRFVYEVLDIHDAMVSQSIGSRILRRCERLLLQRVSVIIISSPAYRAQYFERFHPGLDVAFLVVENKVLHEEVPARPPASRPGQGRLRIGWFGSLRCRASAQLLEDMARRDPEIEVVARGRPLDDILEQLQRCQNELPNFRFVGPYDRRVDLERIYSDVDLVWVVDLYETDFNSTWLLPNRLYEGLALGVVPVAQAGTETGRWLDERGVGVRLEDNELRDLPAQMARVRMDTASLFAGVRSLRREDVVCDQHECESIVRVAMGPN